MTPISQPLADEAATRSVGAALADHLPRPDHRDRALLIALAGELGVGKTTLVRALLRRLGVSGPIKSPSYTLVEPYRTGGRLLLHVDLYRLGDPEEVEFLGLRDEFGAADAILVEWPEKGQGWLPEPDLEVKLEYAATGRVLHLSATTGPGVALRDAMLRAFPD